MSHSESQLFQELKKKKKVVEREARVVPKIQATTMEYTLGGIVKNTWQTLSSLAPRGVACIFFLSKTTYKQISL